MPLKTYRLGFLLALSAATTLSPSLLAQESGFGQRPDDPPRQGGWRRVDERMPQNSPVAPDQAQPPAYDDPRGRQSVPSDSVPRDAYGAPINRGTQAGNYDPRNDGRDMNRMPPPESAPPSASDEFGRLSAWLKLGPQQQSRIRPIWERARASAEPIWSSLMSVRQALVIAARNGSPDSELERLARDQAQTGAQLSAVEAKAFARIYAVLTPQQRTQVDDLGEAWPSILSGGADAQSGPEPDRDRQ